MWGRRSVVAGGIGSVLAACAVPACAGMHNGQTITEYSGRLSASNIRRFAEDATEQVTRTRHVKLNVSLDPTEAGLIVERSSAGLSISLEGQPDWKLIIEG